MFLLDTNTVIYFFKGMGRVAEHVLAVSPVDVAVSSITLFELRVGVAKAGSPKARLEQLQHFVSFVKVLDFTEREAVFSAELRAQLEKAGKPIGPLDNLLAGTAMSRGATFVTRNIREFSRVRGLKVESWY